MSDVQPSYAEVVKRLEEKTKEAESLRKTNNQTGQRIRSLIAGLPLGLIVVTQEQKIQAVNKRARTAFGYTSEELSQKPIQLLFPQIQSISAQADQQLFSAQRKIGQSFTAEVSINLIDFEGEEKFYITFQDVTERQRLEQFRNDLIAMVSHDIRGPLSAIQMALDMIGKGLFGTLSGRGDSVVKNASIASEFLMSMVKNLLDAEKIESGTIEIVTKDTTIGAIIQRAIATFEGRESTVAIETDFTNDAIKADEDRVVQVLINLIGNAIKYSPENSSVIVKAGMEGLHAKFQVIDKGPGVPLDRREKIFERYQQLEQSQDTKKAGFGLGLSICKALVERHDGRIWVESTPGEGSKFCFTIPL